jgi:hypothetical protein
LVPVFGFISGLAVDFVYLLEKQGDTEIEQMVTLDEDDILWKPLKKYQESADIVPLEESLLISNTEIRRKMMLDVLYHDPEKYLEVLLLARFNDDGETAHYATTTIAHVQKLFQLELQAAGAKSQENPTDMEKLDKYIDVIERYIDSGLLEEYLLRNQRILYSELLDRKLSFSPNDKDSLIKKERNFIELGQYLPAYEIIEKLIAMWPDDEQVWIEAIRVCVEGRDKENLKEVLDQIKSSKITWTQAGYNLVETWVGGD